MTTYRITVQRQDPERHPLPQMRFVARAYPRQRWWSCEPLQLWVEAGWGATEREAVGDLIQRLMRPERVYPERTVSEVTLR